MFIEDGTGCGGVNKRGRTDLYSDFVARALRGWRSTKRKGKESKH
jgi:hypothetical protein